MKLVTLPNGIRVFLNPCDSLRSAIVGVWVLSGSRFEAPENAGISHFIEHIVFKGSKKRSGLQIAEGMDEIGAQVNAYTTKEYTFFYVKALDYQILKGADILFDMLKNPKLDEKDIETEKGVILEEIAMCEDDPSDVCYEVNEEAIFASSSLSLQILGSRETVSSFTADDLKRHMEENYSSERMVIGVSGSFNEEEMLCKINEYFAPVKNKNNPARWYDVPFKKGYTLKNMPTEQNHIMLCFPGIGIEHKDLYPLQLIMFILGTGSSSLLNQRIREQLGLVYSIDSWLGRYMGGGYIAVGMSLQEKSEEKAIKETVKIIGNFSCSVNQRQIDIAKEKLISSLIMSREHPQSKFSSEGRNLLLISKSIEDDDIINEIKSITLDRVREVSEKYLKLSEMSFTAVGKVKTKEKYEKIISEGIEKI